MYTLDTAANQDFGAPSYWCHMQGNSPTPLMLALCPFISTSAWNLTCAVLSKIQCCILSFVTNSTACNKILYEHLHTLIFIVTPCINDIKHFIVQLMHTTLKNVELLKYFWNKGGCSNMFRFTMKPSSGSHSQYLAKITHLVQCEYMEVMQTLSALWLHSMTC